MSFILPIPSGEAVSCRPAIYGGITGGSHRWVAEIIFIFNNLQPSTFYLPPYLHLKPKIPFEAKVFLAAHFCFLSPGFITKATEMQYSMKNYPMQFAVDRLPKQTGIVFYPIDADIDFSLYRLIWYI